MGVGYLLDTNAAIDYLDNKLPTKAGDIIDANTIQFSVISRIELLSWPRVTDFQLQVIQSFIETATVFALDENIIIKTSELRRSVKKIKLPDAIIAATALINNLTLITNNTTDFKHIQELSLFNPYKIS